MAIRQTTPHEAYRLLSQGYVYIDVRTAPEFAHGHPVGAMNIPVLVRDSATNQMVINRDFLAVTRQHFPNDAKIIVGCQVGGRSQRAAELLAGAGYTDVVNMQGGFGGTRDQTGATLVPGWSECALPICTECSPEHSYAGLRSATN